MLVLSIVDLPIIELVWAEIHYDDAAKQHMNPYLPRLPCSSSILKFQSLFLGAKRLQYQREQADLGSTPIST